MLGDISVDGEISGGFWNLDAGSFEFPGYNDLTSEPGILGESEGHI